jgi:hypothetical protein
VRYSEQLPTDLWYSIIISFCCPPPLFQDRAEGSYRVVVEWSYKGQDSTTQLWYSLFAEGDLGNDDVAICVQVRVQVIIQQKRSLPF